MEVERDKVSITVSYKRKNFTVEVPSDATVGVLGKQLSQATGVAISTMRLIVPKGKRVSAAAVDPAKEPHSSSTLEASGITPGVVIMMMGASAEEVKEVSQPVKEQRVLGFNEEEKRQFLRRQRVSKTRLPDGPYTFHFFKTLELPFVKLSPPPEKALALMHKLASDPGIVAIMKKYKWQVGVMSELAPEGYVGVSPKCLLGFNKNRGQEISLRLRTDDLQGFRKYESIKMTLLHELAHMVHDEHDENFHALDKLLNREVVILDWTHGPGHTLSGFGRPVDDGDEPVDAGGVRSGHKLGGDSINADAREAAVQAAMERYQRSREAGLHVTMNEPSNSDDSDEISVIAEGTERDGPDELLVITQVTEGDDWGPPTDDQTGRTEPDPDDARASSEEPDPDDSSLAFREPDPDDASTLTEEPDPDDESMHAEEPDPDDESKNAQEPDPDDESMKAEEPDPDDESMNAEEPAQTNNIIDLTGENEELIGMQEEAAAAVGRLQNAVTSIKNQAVATAEASAALNTLLKIVNNLISHPNEEKYKHIRKGNASLQERLYRFQGAVDFLREVGFKDQETEYTVRRLDFGLLFLARSVLERYSVPS
jgi:hypothetical protein